MATGRSNKVTGQTGEYLVAAELGRRGLIATTFTGNVPHYDIVASNEHGQHVSVQVKTIRGGSWQFGNIEQFCVVTKQKTPQGTRQTIDRAKPCPVARLVIVFVRLGETVSEDRFYICTWTRARDLIIRHHKAYLKKHDGIRPKNSDSLHTGIDEKMLKPHRDQWSVVTENLR